MKLLQSALVLLVIFNLLSCGHSYTLWEWPERQRRRVEQKKLAKSEPEENNEIPSEVPTLNVSSKNSPYALIDQFFPERENNRDTIERKFQEKVVKNGSWYKDLGNLSPNEVWLSDGDLLVLKGGSTPNRKAFDNPWTPLDDYVAPYREPKLPPPDFVPSDTGEF